MLISPYTFNSFQQKVHPTRLFHLHVYQIDKSRFPRPISVYYSHPNNRAANLINFLENSILHAFIPSCTFINFEKIASLHVYSILQNYLFSKAFPSCRLFYKSSYCFNVMSVHKIKFKQNKSPPYHTMKFEFLRQKALC